MILPSSGVMRTEYPKSSANTFIALKGEQVTYMGISYVPYVHCTQSVQCEDRPAKLSVYSAVSCITLTEDIVAFSGEWQCYL